MFVEQCYHLYSIAVLYCMYLSIHVSILYLVLHLLSHIPNKLGLGFICLKFECGEHGFIAA